MNYEILLIQDAGEVQVIADALISVRQQVATIDHRWFQTAACLYMECWYCKK